MKAKTKPVPNVVQVAYSRYRDNGLAHCLVIILDSGLYVEVSARTAKDFKRRLKAWCFETLPTLYRSDVRVFLCTKGEMKEVTLSRRSIFP